jgi:hypothetical protein
MLHAELLAALALARQRDIQMKAGRWRWYRAGGRRGLRNAPATNSMEIAHPAGRPCRAAQAWSVPA